MHRLRRILAYIWVSPYTVFGIAVGLLLLSRFRRVDGVIEIYGPGMSFVLNHLPVPAMAMTMGHVIFGQTEAALDITRRHEHVHVRQYERWGPMFVPTYLAISVFLYVRGRDGYRENPFEVEAYGVDGREPE